MKSQNERSSADRASQTAQAYRSAHEVVSAAASLAVMAGVGYWLDERYGSGPILVICGACLGFLLAGLSLRGLLRRLDREAADRNRRSDAGRGRGHR